MYKLNKNVNTLFFSFQTKCFICGIGNDYFDRTPHGFETHTLQEHNLANYLWVQQRKQTMTKVWNVSIISDHIFMSSCLQILPDVPDQQGWDWTHGSGTWHVQVSSAFRSVRCRLSWIPRQISLKTAKQDYRNFSRFYLCNISTHLLCCIRAAGGRSNAWAHFDFCDINLLLSCTWASSWFIWCSCIALMPQI